MLDRAMMARSSPSIRGQAYITIAKPWQPARCSQPAQADPAGQQAVEMLVTIDEEDPQSFPRRPDGTGDAFGRAAHDAEVGFDGLSRGMRRAAVIGPAKESNEEETDGKEFHDGDQNGEGRELSDFERTHARAFHWSV